MPGENLAHLRKKQHEVMSSSNDTTIGQALACADAHIERVNKVPPLTSVPESRIAADSDITTEESVVSE